MANGMLEPSLNKVHDAAVSIECEEGEERLQTKFQTKLTAYVAPIKGYDVIIGRDMLQKWAAVLDMRSAEDVRLEGANREGHSEDDVNHYEGLSVYDKTRKKRVQIDPVWEEQFCSEREVASESNQ